jgi:PncC family amidohydrolase
VTPNTAKELIDRLRKQNAKICTVESCTGGKLASLITEVAGASDVFWGSWVVYDNLAKKDMLEVSESLISKHGAVSEEVVKELSANALNQMKRSLNQSSKLYSISLSGIAGPTGATADKPVGLCFIGLQMDERFIFKKIIAPQGQDRVQNIQYFASQAIELLLAQFPN